MTKESENNMTFMTKQFELLLDNSRDAYDAIHEISEICIAYLKAEYNDPKKLFE